MNAQICYGSSNTRLSMFAIRNWLFPRESVNEALKTASRPVESKTDSVKQCTMTLRSIEIMYLDQHPETYAICKGIVQTHSNLATTKVSNTYEDDDDNMQTWSYDIPTCKDLEWDKFIVTVTPSWQYDTLTIRITTKDDVPFTDILDWLAELCQTYPVPSED